MTTDALRGHFERGAGAVPGAEWVPFSHRYGITTPLNAARWDTATWRFRHSDEVANGFAPELYRCVCPGTSARRRCADRASQEDRLCDACREHCVAVDSVGKYHRLVDVHGAAS